MKSLLLGLLAFLILPLSAQEGWVDLSGTEGLGQLETTGNWTRQDDGSIMLKPREGEAGWKRYASYLWAPKQYENFIFDFDFKYEAKGNSGFYFHVADKADPVGKGIEVQIKDDFGKEKIGSHDMGGIIKTQGPTQNACKPAGEWNNMVVTCIDKKLKVVLNGKLVNEADLSASKMKDRPAKGWISLQDHGLPFWVRNLKVKEL